MTLSPRMAVLGLDLVEEVFRLGQMGDYGYVESEQNSTHQGKLLVPSKATAKAWERLLYGPSVGGLTPKEYMRVGIASSPRVGNRAAPGFL
jgi:hypothetical protein